MGDLDYRLEVLRQQAGMARHALRHLLAPSALDWLTSGGHVGRSIGRWVDDDLEAMQRPNAEVAFVSTPVDGLGAGLTANGRVSVLLGPSTGAGHLSPYHVDGDGPLLGAPPMAGQFAGLDAGDGPAWLWDRDVAVDYDGPGVVAATYEPRAGGETDLPLSARSGTDPPLPARSATFVAPGTDTLVRQYAIENPGDRARDVSFVYHARANVNDGLQTFGVWASSPNVLAAADGELRWRDRDGPTQLRVRLDRPATAVGREPGGAFDGGGSGDAEVTGTTLEGRLRADLTVPADGEARVAVLATAGEEPAWDGGLVDRSSAARRAAVDDWWAGWLPDEFPEPGDGDVGGVGPSIDGAGAAADGGSATGDDAAGWPVGSVDPGAAVEGAGAPSVGTVGAAPVNPPGEGPPARADDATLAALRRRSVAVLGALADPDSGSLSASPNLQPTYYPCWPRDAAFAAVALARAGCPAPARAVLAEFLPGVQEDDGRFRQCYDGQGRFAGVVDVEADQQPQYAWAVRAVAGAIGDQGFVETTWPAVRDALRHTVATVEPDGLLAPTPDVDEYPDAVRQSLWTNAWAYRGLADGAALAERVGANPDPYERAANLVGQSLAREFFAAEPYVTYRDADGDHHDPHPYDAVALQPTGWAAAFGVADRVERDARELAREDHPWVPGRFMLAAALYRRDAAGVAEDLLRRTAALTTAAGHLVEVPAEDADHHFASPLAWSHAAYLLAMEARAEVRGA